ncbi:MAG TPA: hypothetical protein VGE35_03755 [Candidatus Paceibacterota bacterium]
MTQFATAKVQAIEKPITSWVLLAIIGLLVSAYIALVAGAVSNAIAAKGMQSQISALTSSIGSLETQYVAAKSAITLDSALAQGYSEPAEAIVYIAKSSAASLSLNR